jgi:NADH-quinone oxidoreductase subunit C
MKIVEAGKIVEECKSLRDEKGFDCLSCLSGVDAADHFEVVYHLFSYRTKEDLVLKVSLGRENPSLPSVSSVWPSADWMERETHELFGIVFEGHPDLSNLLLPEDWVGHPMRKDYKEQEQYHGIGTTRVFDCD